MAEWFTLGVLLIVFIFTIYLLKKYPAKNISYIVYISVFYGWFSSLVIITLIPYDIYLSLGGSGNKVILTYSWYFVYWSIFGLCWVIFPVMLAFHNSGDFTFFLRLKRAIYKETKFFLLEFGIALCFVIYLYFLEHLQFIQIPQILILMSSIWGLFLIVLMLGYGLVAVPLSTWKSANLKKKLSILQTRAVPVADAKTNNLHELKQVSSRIVQMNSAVSEGSPLKKYSEMLLVYCVTHNWSLISPSSVKNVEYKDLVKLHEDAKKLTIEKERLES